MSNSQARLARALVFACLFPLSFAYLFPRSAVAGSVTTTFTAQIAIAAACAINSASSLNFGTQGGLAANADPSSTIQVTCTNTTPYTIGLDAGTGAGATVAARKLSSAGNTVSYTLY